MKHLLALLLLLPTLALAQPSVLPGAPCHAETRCEIGPRSYNVREPDGWDGVTPLPVLLHFHGWGRQGELIVQHARIAGATRLRGVLLLAPNGQGRTWNFRAGSPDVAFARAVIEDAATRYPIDRDRIYVSGYSFGAIMAWRFACEAGSGVAALLSISGTLPQDTDCPQAPREVRHVHGLDDGVIDFPMGPGGDTTYPVALWRARMGCGDGRAAGTWSVVDFLTLTRTEWDCAQGRVNLDVHPGGHFIPHGWIGRQLDELLGRPPTYP